MAPADIAQRSFRRSSTTSTGIPVFPLAGRASDDVRPGMWTSTFKKRTLIAYQVDESTGELVVNIPGPFHGGQDREAALREHRGDSAAGR